MFISIVDAMIRKNKFWLKENIYIAFKWLPRGAGGTCTLARLEHATWVWETNDLPYQHIPKHMLAKRDLEPMMLPTIPTRRFTHSNKLIRADPSSWDKVGMYLPYLSTYYMSTGVLRNAKQIEDMGELFDNVTDYLFDTIEVNSIYLRQVIIVENQHAVILDYLTAAQGGLCQIVGPSCCHYINSQGMFRVSHDLQQANKLKEGYREAHQKLDESWPEWLSWLNPQKWFQGIGGWFQGIFHMLLQGCFLILIIFIVIKVILLIGKKILKSTCFSGRTTTTTVIQPKDHPSPVMVMMSPVTTSNESDTIVVTPVLKSDTPADHCSYCNQMIVKNITDCIYCGSPTVEQR